MYNRFELFTGQVIKANRYVHKIKAEEMQEFSLRSAHVSCLYYLYTSKSLTAKELCDLSGEDKANVSRTLDYLEKSGYISPRPKTKGYNTPLTLTEQGVETGKKINEKIEKVLSAISDGVTEEERKNFYRTFEKINNNLEKIYNLLGEQNEKN